MMKRYRLTIEGMGCAHCVKSVTDALTSLGATVHACEIGTAEVLFSGDPNAMKEAVADRGFTVTAVLEA